MKSYSLFEVWQKIILRFAEETEKKKINKDSSLKVKFLKIWGIIFLL